jgi:regulator of protease activity HflC (stomatin/prohibitin superfamily)
MKEKLFKPFNGYVFLVLLLVWVGLAVWFGTQELFIWLAVDIVLIFFWLPGFFIVFPNSSKVLTLFGKYSGTIKKDGFWWALPFYAKQHISLRARNFDSERVKVNDKLGNPILISVILVWRVKDTYKAAFEVDEYEQFVRVQSDAAVRKMAVHYSYDNFDDDQSEVTLRSGLEEINHRLEEELDKRLAIAGIDVMEARIGYLAYANEIAQAMLKRQQAEAIIAARMKIVEGAVSMVDIALKRLSEEDIIELDDDKKAAMVSNLMVVLTSDKDTTPIVNTGTLYQ